MAKENEYINRLIDKKIDKYLSVFGAIYIEGPKWCGKTWSSVRHAKNVKYLDDESTLKLAKYDLDLFLNGEYPILIDEWHLVPKVWDKVRRKCDEDTVRGKYILTCSTELNDEKQKEVFHSGAGRIGKIKMYPMSLYESGDSDGFVSLSDMYNDTFENKIVKSVGILDIAKLIERGGWPSNINSSNDTLGVIPNSYIESVLDKDVNDDKKRDRNKMKMLLKSLSRNESSIASNKTILCDIEDIDNDNLIESRITLIDYIDALDRLHIIDNIDAYSENYRSRERIGKSPKRHLVDPSLACACLNLNYERLLKDLKIFGLLFESLVERDLRIYIESLDGNLYHFRDNITGLEVDSILEFKGGDYAAVEIKLGNEEIEDGKKSLLKFKENMLKEPKFMCIITANIDYAVKDPETGIYILPITSLRP